MKLDNTCPLCPCKMEYEFHVTVRALHFSILRSKFLKYERYAEHYFFKNNICKLKCHYFNFNA